MGVYVYAWVIIQFYHLSSSKRSGFGRWERLQVGSRVLSTAPISFEHFLSSGSTRCSSVLPCPHPASTSSPRIPAFLYWKTVLKSQDLGAGGGGVLMENGR